MRIQHFAIIFIILILPFSIVCRANINDKIDTINDETRINHALDTATYDAIDTIRDLNDEFYSMYEGQTIDVTPAIAKEGIKTFYETMSLNYNLPFVGDESFNQDYFSPYIPAVLVIAYDGFYIYSVERNSSGVYSYSLSPKIPYTYEYVSSSNFRWYINFSLGNYIGLYAPNGVYYQGEFTRDFVDQAIDDYNEINQLFDDKWETLGMIPSLTGDMSLTMYALSQLYSQDDFPPFLYTLSSSGKVSMLADYSDARRDDSNSTPEISDDVSDFHRIRRETIINLIMETLNEKMNNHNRFADMLGITYDFFLPNIPHEDWINAVDDVSVMAFVQGIPIGAHSYYNSYALGASRIIQTEYIYCGQKEKIPSNKISTYGNPGDVTKLYHKKHCPLITNDNGEVVESLIDDIFINRNDAARNGYYPCLVCKP